MDCGLNLPPTTPVREWPSFVLRALCLARSRSSSTRSRVSHPPTLHIFEPARARAPRLPHLICFARACACRFFILQFGHRPEGGGRTRSTGRQIPPSVSASSVPRSLACSRSPRPRRCDAAPCRLLSSAHILEFRGLSLDVCLNLPLPPSLVCAQRRPMPPTRKIPSQSWAKFASIDDPRLDQ